MHADINDGLSRAQAVPATPVSAADNTESTIKLPQFRYNGDQAEMSFANGNKRSRIITPTLLRSVVLRRETKYNQKF